MDKDEILKRLKNVEGHVGGIERMVANDAYCIDVIRQVQAVQAALSKISAIVLSDHMNDCLIKAVKGEDPEEKERVLREITEVYELALKV